MSGPDFFQAGRAYSDGMSVSPTRFLCVALSVHPLYSNPAAFGWTDKTGPPDWRGIYLTSRDWVLRSWTEIEPPPGTAAWAGRRPAGLAVSREIYDAIVAHARADHPDEACGVVAGPEGSDRPERFVPMTNAERSPTFYRLDSDEQFKVWREMGGRDEEPVIIYHSHTSTEAYPSRTDARYASEPDAHYVLVSTRDADKLGEFQFRSFRIVEGEVTEEPVTVIP